MIRAIILRPNDSLIGGHHHNFGRLLRSISFLIGRQSHRCVLCLPMPMPISYYACSDSNFCDTIKLDDTWLLLETAQCISLISTDRLVRCSNYKQVFFLPSTANGAGLKCNEFRPVLWSMCYLERVTWIRLYVPIEF